MQPGNPVIGGTSLVPASMHSPGFIHNTQGWSVNKDGTAEFQSATIRGTLTLGNGSTNTVIFDSVRNAVFVYDNAGHLIASIAPNTGTDSFGNTYQAGITSYSAVNINDYVQVFNNNVFFHLHDTGSNSAFLETQNALGTNDSPAMMVRSPANDGSDTAVALDLFGMSNDGTQKPYMNIRQRGTAGLLPVYLGGVLTHMDSAGTREVWHAASLSGGWSNIGAPFAVAQYRITGDGDHVELAGLVLSGVAGAPNPVFTLPVGYRPISQKNVASGTSPSPTVNPTTCSIQITTAGVVQVTNYSGTNIGAVSLENVQFSLTS